MCCEGLTYSQCRISKGGRASQVLKAADGTFRLWRIGCAVLSQTQLCVKSWAPQPLHRQVIAVTGSGLAAANLFSDNNNNSTRMCQDVGRNAEGEKCLLDADWIYARASLSGFGHDTASLEGASLSVRRQKGEWSSLFSILFPPYWRKSQLGQLKRGMDCARKWNREWGHAHSFKDPFPLLVPVVVTESLEQSVLYIYSLWLHLPTAGKRTLISGGNMILCCLVF